MPHDPKTNPRQAVAGPETLPEALKPRVPGLLKGKVRIAPDFDAPLPTEVNRAFRGEAS